MTTPHPPAGPTLAAWLQQQIEADQLSAAADHADSCQARRLAATQDDAHLLVGPQWCTCAQKQALRETRSRALLLGLASGQYQDKNERTSFIGWMAMLYLGIPYFDRPGYLAVMPYGHSTMWRRP
ncbi:hypothetical protein [Micromonospora maritima]|uniref:hypothetical protein n=1 Tax=Micromonospora maritima TaxID=986711 RepID=UPI00157C51FE|nr:hypothetical protein [Micromonospora maritima]